MELLAEHQAEPSPLAGLLAELAVSAPPDALQPAPGSPGDGGATAAVSPTVTTPTGFAASAASTAAIIAPQSLGRFLRTRTDRVQLRSWR
jgi:hypothetical protein